MTPIPPRIPGRGFINRLRPAVALGALALLSGCATSAGPPGIHFDGAAALAPKTFQDSAVDISYVLGHTRRRLVAWARGDAFGGQALMEHQILRESEIDRARYADFFAKAEQFVGTAAAANAGKRPGTEAQPAARSVAQSNGDDSCRAPFTVTVRVGAESRTAQGCRGGDDGSGLSRLVRDGEFLLYSAGR